MRDVPARGGLAKLAMRVVPSALRGTRVVRPDFLTILASGSGSESVPELSSGMRSGTVSESDAVAFVLPRVMGVSKVGRDLSALRRVGGELRLCGGGRATATSGSESELLLESMSSGTLSESDAGVPAGRRRGRGALATLLGASWSAGAWLAERRVVTLASYWIRAGAGARAVGCAGAAAAGASATAGLCYGSCNL